MKSSLNKPDPVIIIKKMEGFFFKSDLLNSVSNKTKLAEYPFEKFEESRLYNLINNLKDSEFCFK